MHLFTLALLSAIAFCILGEDPGPISFTVLANATEYCYDIRCNPVSALTTNEAENTPAHEDCNWTASAANIVTGYWSPATKTNGFIKQMPIVSFGTSAVVIWGNGWAVNANAARLAQAAADNPDFTAASGGMTCK